MTRPSEQLEHEAETVRWQLSQTLDELRGRITPGQVVDEVVEYARDGGGAEFVRNLGRQVKENPLPLTLIGAGVAWLIIGTGRPRVDGVGTRDTGRVADGRGGRIAGGLADAAGDAADRLVERAEDSLAVLGKTAADTKARADAALDRAANAAEDAAHSAQDTARSAWRRASEGVQEATHSAQDTVASTYRRVARKTGDAAGRIGNSTAAAVRSTATASRSALDFCREQPLVLAGLGLAVGAAIGALLPRTRLEEDLEQDLIGEPAEEGKDRTRPSDEPAGHTASASVQQIDNAAATPEALPGGDEGQAAKTDGKSVTDGESG